MTPPRIAEAFVSLTCMFEDMHAIVVEGQRVDLSPDMARALAAHVTAGLSSAKQMIDTIEGALP